MISKKIISFILLFIISFSTLIVPYAYSATSTTTISSADVNKTIEYAEGLVGTYHKKSYCLNFVVTTWTDALGGNWKTGACCATKARKQYRKSKSRNDIPKGASVFFTRNNGTCSKCKSHPGHVGIYVGQELNIKSGVLEDKIVHCYTNGEIKKSSIDQIIADGYTYSGWGYPSGKKIETLSEIPKNSELSIIITCNLDKTNNIHTEGKSLGLYGTISSSYNISAIRGSVINSKGKVVLSSKDFPGSKKVNINTCNLNKSLTFGDLGPGFYTLKIEVVDASGRKITKTRKFEVVENKNTNIVTGTVVNLNKLGWKTVSIRKGASTNYKIIGDMTTGAKCTVNLSKSTTNWYYIEYNGIKGYASKKGISI